MGCCHIRCKYGNDNNNGDNDNQIYNCLIELNNTSMLLIKKGLYEEALHNKINILKFIKCSNIYLKYNIKI